MTNATIGAVTQVAAPAQVKQSSSTALKIGSETFLTLLLAQLKNQDPMKPMESTEYVAQLATLSNLEQAAQQTAKLDQVLSVLSLSQAQAVIGRTVASTDGAIAGRVVSARVTSQGVVAELDSGKELVIEPGKTVIGL
jgi:flagellar basal-body rod modification protein FlgD